MAPNGARSLFSTNPDLSNILGDTDFDIDIFLFFGFCRFQIYRFPGSQITNFKKSGNFQKSGLGQDVHASLPPWTHRRIDEVLPALSFVN